MHCWSFGAMCLAFTRRPLVEWAVAPASAFFVGFGVPVRPHAAHPHLQVPNASVSLSEGGRACPLPPVTAGGYGRKTTFCYFGTGEFQGRESRRKTSASIRGLAFQLWIVLADAVVVSQVSVASGGRLPAPIYYVWSSLICLANLLDHSCCVVCAWTPAYRFYSPLRTRFGAQLSRSLACFSSHFLTHKGTTSYNEVAERVTTCNRRAAAILRAAR